VVNKATVIIVAAFVVLLFDLVIKFRYEDSLLLKVYPEATSYQKEVGALFPKLF